MEETKLDERNITENRTQRKNYIVNREENTYSNREKIELKKMYSQLFGEEQVREIITIKLFPQCLYQFLTIKKMSFFLKEEDIFSTQDKGFLLVLEEFQNANVSNNIASVTRHPRTCTSQEKTVHLEFR